MRILWHSPLDAPTAYALQAGIFAPRLAAQGHEVVFSRMQRSPTSGPVCEGLPVVDRDKGAPEFALPRPASIRTAFGGRNPDLVIVLKDAWVLNPGDYRPWNTAVWCDIDVDPMGWADREFFEKSGARPIAVSKWATSVMRDAGLDPLYVPHGIETGQWSPHPDGKDQAKKDLGLDPGLFVVGMNAHNVGVPSRKGFGEGFRAFAAFHGKLQPKSVLLCHSQPAHPDGLDLHALVHACGLGGKVLFPDRPMAQPDMLAWYRALDVFLAPTYGEGFCVPAVEAVACGAPVIATRCSAMTEKVTAPVGWLVDGQEWWHPQHRSWWVVPNIRQIAAHLGKAEVQRRRVPPELAAPYDADYIAREHWKPALETLAAGHG